MKKKALWIAAAAAIMTLGLAGCGNSSSNSSSGTSNLPAARFKPSVKTPSWKKDTKKAVTLTWYVNYDWFKRAPWGKDAVSAQIKKDMNVNIKWVIGSDEKLNTMMASGKLPDLMTFDRTLAVAQQAQKFALPLNKLSKKYDPYFMATAAKPQTVKWYTKSDGNIYGYPSFSYTNEDYKAKNVQGDQVFIVRKDIYDKIGKPDMSTPQGFLNALKKAKEVQPKTDKGAALVPFAGTALDIQNGGDGAFGGTLQDFLAIPVTKNDKWYDRDADPEYWTWLNTLREAYQDGLITDGQFADNDVKMKEKLTQGTYFAYLHSNTKGLNEFMSDNNQRNAKEGYEAIDGPKNAQGATSTFTGGSLSGWTNTFITNKTSDPQKAMELITYLASKYGTMVATFGSEGTNYEMQNGKAVFKDATEKLRNTDIATYDQKMGMGNYWFVSDDAYAISKGEQPATSIRQFVAWAKDKTEPRFQVEDIDPTPGSDLARALTQINTERVQTLVKVIKSGSEADAKKTWNAFLKDRKNNKFDEITAYRNKKIASNLKRLQ